MKKILVIEDWDDFLRSLYPSEQRLLERIAQDHELKDVIEFETDVKVAVTPGGKELYQMINLPRDKTKGLKYGDTVQVYLVKQKKKEEKKR